MRPALLALLCLVFAASGAAAAAACGPFLEANLNSAVEGMWPDFGIRGELLGVCHATQQRCLWPVDDRHGRPPLLPLRTRAPPHPNAPLTRFPQMHS